MIWHWVEFPKNKKIFTPVANFKAKWKNLVDTPVFMLLTWTAKVHYISDHFSDYFKDPLIATNVNIRKPYEI